MRLCCLIPILRHKFWPTSELESLVETWVIDKLCCLNGELGEMSYFPAADRLLHVVRKSGTGLAVNHKVNEMRTLITGRILLRPSSTDRSRATLRWLHVGTNMNSVYSEW